MITIETIDKLIREVEKYLIITSEKNWTEIGFRTLAEALRAHNELLIIRTTFGPSFGPDGR